MAKKVVKKAAPKKAAPKKAASKKSNDIEVNEDVERAISMTNPFTQLTDNILKEAKNNVAKYKGNHEANKR